MRKDSHNMANLLAFSKVRDMIEFIIRIIMQQTRTCDCSVIYRTIKANPKRFGQNIYEHNDFYLKEGWIFL